MHLSYAVAPLLACGVLAGCATSPTDADPREFCRALGEASTATDHTDFPALQAAAGRLEAMGSPQGYDGRVRDGFLIYVQVVEGASDSGDVDDVFDDLNPDEQAKLDAFHVKAAQTCAGIADLRHLG